VRHITRSLTPFAALTWDARKLAPVNLALEVKKTIMALSRETKIIHNEAGDKLAEMEMVDGRPHGVMRQWSESGVLTVETEMEDGQYHGTYKSWWANGNLKEVGSYSQGKRIGIYKWFKPTGELWNEHNYG